MKGTEKCSMVEVRLWQLEVMTHDNRLSFEILQKTSDNTHRISDNF